MTDPKRPAGPVSDEAVTLEEDALDAISGGPNRRAHDHIGNFNFKVEINGVAGDPDRPLSPGQVRNPN